MPNSPSFCWSIFTCHKNATIFSNTFCLIHSIEKLLANWNISRRECLNFRFIQGKSSQEQCNNSFFIFDLLPIVSPINSSSKKVRELAYLSSRKLPARSSNILLDSFVRANWVSASSQLAFIAATWAWSSRSFWLRSYSIINLGGKETTNALNPLRPMLPRISYSLPSTCSPYPSEDIFVPSSQILQESTLPISLGQTGHRQNHSKLHHQVLLQLPACLCPSE